MNLISLCITSYNRTDLLYESFAQVMNDERISEIVIVDDCSNPVVWAEINEKLGSIDKIKLFRNAKNLGCYRNKREAVSKASNEWVILLDSDNAIGIDYIDAVHEWPLDPVRILQPTFARPHFDFTMYRGKLVHQGNVAKWAYDPTFTTALNAMNYFVNRDEYLRVWEDCQEPWTSDSILQNYNWLKAGNSIYFCPGLEYFHKVDDYGKEEKSHYQTNNKRTAKGFHESIIAKLKALK
jgi:glycosyltransferase involved in cell wall biosynthesis